MISVWWLLVAFVGGGWAGILLMALMRMSADLPEQSVYAPNLDRTPPQADRFGMVDGFKAYPGSTLLLRSGRTNSVKRALTP